MLKNISQPPTDRKNLINKIKVNANVHTIADNLDEFVQVLLNMTNYHFKKF